MASPLSSVLGSTTPTVSFDNVSGVTTGEIVTALLGRYEEPVDYVTEEQSAIKTQISAFQSINTDFQSLLTASETLAKASSWDLATADSSDTSVASALSSAGAQLGSASFTVTQLAQANIMASTHGVASPAQEVTEATSMVVATGTAALGFSAIAAPGNSLTHGIYAVKVSQASSGATVVASGALPTTISIGTSATVALTVDGQHRALSIQAGTYTAPQLVAQINATAQAQTIPIAASLTATGALELSTTAQGADAKIVVLGTPDSIAGTLGLESTQSGVGTSAVITINGHQTTVATVTSGGTIRAQAGADSTTTITLTVAAAPGPTGSLISAGTAKLGYLSTGSRTLTALVSAINESGLTVTASSVKTSTGDYIFQVEAGRSGGANAVYMTSTIFAPAGGPASPLGSLESIQTASTAELRIGDTNGYVVSSPTDTFDGLLQGTAITVTALGAASVVVSANATAQATAVEAFASAANTLLSTINSYTGYTDTTDTAGVLLGNPVVESLRTQVLAAFSSVNGTSSLANLRTVGISLTKTGTITFTRTKFLSSYRSTATQVKALFSQGGTFASSSPEYSSSVSFQSALTTTPAGKYAVKVNSWATEATSTGATVGPTNTVTAPETLTFTQGGESVSYTTTGRTGSAAGESLTEIANALTQTFTDHRMAIRAFVTEHRLVVQSTTYGTSGSFTVESTLTADGGGLGLVPSATSPVDFTGKNIAGTIGGVAATGIGNTLVAANGLTLTVTGQGAPGALLGTFTYSPGVAQELLTLSLEASTSVSGSITGQIGSLTTESKSYTAQIATYKQMEVTERQTLVEQYAKMDSAIEKLKNEGSALTSAIAKLTASKTT